MSRDSWFSVLFARPHGSFPRGRRSQLAAESLEIRTMLTTLTVDIGDPTANDPGDNLYAEIQEAVDAASPGDKIKVHAGTYNPFVVEKDNLTIREAKANSNPVVDGNLSPGDENGVEVNANRVTIRGLTVQNASGSFADETGTGFLVRGDNNTLKDNTANDNVSNGFVVDNGDDNTFIDNTASDNGSDNRSSGFVLFDGSDGNTLKGNIASDNGDDSSNAPSP